MKLGTKLVCTGLALVVLLSAVLAVSAEERPHRAGGGAVRGKVESKSQSSLALTTHEGDTVISVNPNTRYWVQGVEHPTLDDVQIGDAVLVRGSKDEFGSMTALAVLVVPPVPVGALRGEVAAIEGQTLVLATRGEEKNLLTDKDTQFRVPHVEEATLADIQVGDRVFVLGGLDVGGTLLARLVALIPEGAVGPISARGRVTAANDESLLVQIGDNVATVTIEEDSHLRVPGIEDATLTDISVGDWVLAVGRPTGLCEMTALAVRVLPAIPTHRFTVRGQVEGIKDSEITVQDGEGENRLILIDDETRLIVAGVKEPTMADIHVGDGIRVLGAPAEDDVILARLIFLRPSVESQINEPSL